MFGIKYAQKEKSAKKLHVRVDTGEAICIIKRPSYDATYLYVEQGVMFADQILIYNQR